MKKIIIILIVLTGVLMAQWVAVNPKPPTTMKRLSVSLNFWNTEARDSLQQVIPDSFNISYDVNYQIFMYNEYGQLVKADITQGDLTEYMTANEKVWLKAFLDKYGALAVGLLP